MAQIENNIQSLKDIVQDLSDPAIIPNEDKKRFITQYERLYDVTCQLIETSGLNIKLNNILTPAQVKNNYS